MCTNVAVKHKSVKGYYPLLDLLLVFCCLQELKAARVESEKTLQSVEQRSNDGLRKIEELQTSLSICQHQLQVCVCVWVCVHVHVRAHTCNNLNLVCCLNSY